MSRELAEYGIIFADGEEGTWLDKVDQIQKIPLV